MKGGARPGAGRKPKSEEIELIERLSPMDAVALKKLKEGVNNGEFAYLKLFMEYRFGKPKETVNVTAKNTNIEVIRVVDVDGTEI